MYSIWSQESLKSLGDAQEERSYSLSVKLRRKIWARQRFRQVGTVQLLSEKGVETVGKRRFEMIKSRLFIYKMGIITYL